MQAFRPCIAQSNEDVNELRQESKPTLSSSFLGLPYRILYINPKKEVLRGLWVNPKP